MVNGSDPWCFIVSEVYVGVTNIYELSKSFVPIGILPGLFSMVPFGSEEL
jgi:hypothetical protein